MPYSPLLLAGIAGAVCAAGCVQGILGFGFGIVAMGLLPLLLGLKGAVPVVATLALVVNSALLVRFRASFSLRDAAPLLGGALFGIPVGVLALRFWPSDILMILLGLFILLYVVWGLSNQEAPPPMSRTAGGVFGLLAGVLGGAFSTAGPPAVVWVSSQTWSSQQIRATLVALFALGGSLQVSLLVHGGLVDLGTATVAVIATPAAGFGSLVGVKLGDRVPQEQFRKVMLVGLGVLAVVFIANGVRSE